MAWFLYTMAQGRNGPSIRELRVDDTKPTAEPSGLATYLDAALAMLDLPVEPELRARVLMHFEIASGMADLVMSFPMSDEAEPAPVYVP